MNKESEELLKRLKEKDAHIVYSLKELESFIRRDRDVSSEMFEEDIEKYGHTLISMHASTTGEPVWYFPDNPRPNEEYVIARAGYKNRKV